MCLTILNDLANVGKCADHFRFVIEHPAICRVLPVFLLSVMTYLLAFEHSELCGAILQLRVVVSAESLGAEVNSFLESFSLFPEHKKLDGSQTVCLERFVALTPPLA